MDRIAGLVAVGLVLLLGSSVSEAANTTGVELTTCVSGKPPGETIDGCTKIMALPDLDAAARRNAFLIRGNAYLVLNELGLAIADFRGAQDIKDTPDVSVELADIYVNAGRSEDAIKEFTKVIDAGEASAVIFNGRGAAFENAGKYDEAIQDFNKALLLAPNFLMAVNNRAAAYAKQGNYTAAMKDIDAVLAKNPDMPVALVNRCAYQERAGRFDQGRPSCDRAEHLDPDNAFLLENIGFVYYEAGQFEKAIDYIDKGLRLVPNSAPALYVRGKAKGKLGNTSEGDVDVATAERIQPDVGAFLARGGFKP